MNDDAIQYSVEATDAARFAVRDVSGTCIIECRDEVSAAHYAELLERAYRKGVRDGYRRGKLAAPGRGSR